MAINSELWTVTEIGLTDLCKMADADDILKYTRLDILAKDIICSCLSRDQFGRIMHLRNSKLIWDRISDVYEGHRTRHDPWFEDFKESLKTMTFEPESSSSASCLVADGAEVTECSSSEFCDDESDNDESDNDESDDDIESSYTKLVCIATKQQMALEQVQNMLDKSDDMLRKEMDQSKELGECLQRIHSKFDVLQDQHNALLTDHEKLSLESFQRKEDLEKLRVCYEDLQKERDSLLAQ